MDLEEALQRASVELEEAEAQLRATEARVKELQTIRDGLRFALARYGKRLVHDSDQIVGREQEMVAGKPGQDAEMESPRVQGVPLASQVEGSSQADRTFGALRELGGKAATHEVRGKLVAAGYSYSQEQVRSALTYLMRMDRIKRIAPGMWEIPGRQEAS
jgi:hypothetical protein